LKDVCCNCGKTLIGEICIPCEQDASYKASLEADQAKTKTLPLEKVSNIVICKIDLSNCTYPDTERWVPGLHFIHPPPSPPLFSIKNTRYKENIKKFIYFII